MDQQRAWWDLEGSRALPVSLLYRIKAIIYRHHYQNIFLTLLLSDARNIINAYFAYYLKEKLIYSNQPEVKGPPINLGLSSTCFIST